MNDWIMLAKQDIRAASVIIVEEHLTNIVAFHCQQAIEKCFKAYILENDMQVLKIHDLPKLYGMIKEIRDFGIDEDILALINETYIEDRYPGEFGLLQDVMPSDEQAHDFLEFAKQIEEIIETELRNGK
ncbi:MAG: HEPN domain-containing protein [Bacteroidales bacterium]|nr:HEPN domain-containing protein [Bacteroidales bacterium]